MKISILLAHPDKKSFNHAIAQAALKAAENAGHDVRFHDLYQEKFPPELPADEIPRNVKLPKIIKKHCDELAEAEGIIIVHPNWWGQPPAILKGWVDRVLRPGVAYTFAETDVLGEGDLIGLLKAEAVLVFNTSNTKPDREVGVYGDPLELLWKNNLLVTCGVKNYYRQTFRVIVTSTPEQRKYWLTEVGEAVNKYFPAGE
jgi:NAD(P)H dehydrogenase (quinone)